MKSTLIRKQDSEATVVRKLIRREVNRQLTEDSNPRSANMVQNYAFGSGGGSFGSGGTSSGTSKLNADAYSSGTLTNVSRKTLQAVGGAYLMDNPNGDAVRIETSVVNDPMYWLMGG